MNLIYFKNIQQGFGASIKQSSWKENGDHMNRSPEQKLNLLLVLQNSQHQKQKLGKTPQISPVTQELLLQGNSIQW